MACGTPHPYWPGTVGTVHSSPKNSAPPPKPIAVLPYLIILFPLKIYSEWQLWYGINVSKEGPLKKNSPDHLT